MAETTEKIHDQVTWPETWPVFDDGTGGLAFPEQNNSNCPDGSPVTIEVEPVITYGESGESVELDCSPSYSMKIEPDRIYVRLSDFNSVDRTFTTVDVYNSSSFFDGTTSYLVPNTEDPLDCTGLVIRRDPETGEIDSDTCVISNIVQDSADPRLYTFSISNAPVNGFKWTATDDPGTAITFDLAIDLNLGENDSRYINLQHQDDLSENGVYCYRSGSVQKIATSPVMPSSVSDDVVDDITANDNVPCCNHFRKTYSHKEVADYTLGQMGSVTAFGVKSMSVTDCDGGFIDWFTTDGEVNIGNGHVPIFVNGFGLGQVYKASGTNTTVKSELPRDDYDENDNTIHPWLTWAYGTRSDARTTTNLVALPRDWPFHGVSSSTVTKYDEVTDTNNITLVKHGVVGPDSSVGNLEYDREVEGGDTEHVLINRHHVVLYPEFSTLNNKVTVKPTFIHLPASMDTKDGETVELTVSIQNVDQNAFGDGSAATLSGYCSAMAQPRVYVMGGVQKFSNKRMPIDKSSIEQNSEVVTEDDETRIVYTDYNLSTSVVAKSATGVPLEVGTEVRANILVSKANATGERRKFTAIGHITSIDGDGSSVLGGGTTFNFKGKFPYDIGGRGWNDYIFTVCGIAYLDEDDNPTETKMGLVGRNDDVMKNDTGSGASGEYDQYNKFYSVANKDSSIERTEMPHVDKRFLLATVYQSATNTFQWNLVGRHRMSKLSRIWTDEPHRSTSSNKSIVQRIYEQNKHLVDAFRTDAVISKMFTQHPSFWPVSYVPETGWSWESLGSVVQVLHAAIITTPITSFFGNPVRQASRAMQEFENDFNHMRILSAKGSTKARVKVTGINIDRNEGSWPSAGDSIISQTIKPCTDGYSDTDWQAELINSSWCANVRSLPEYVLDADTRKDATQLFSNDTLSLDDWTEYISKLPYNTGADNDYESVACIDEAPQTVVGTPWDYETYSSNSACEKLVKRIHASTANYLTDDIKRYSETVLSIKVPDDYMDLPSMYSAFDTQMDKTYDWCLPFTNIHSIDGAPVPSISTDVYSGLNGDQQQFAIFDAIQMYRFAYADKYPDSTDSIDDVSTVMPEVDDTPDNALTKFIEKYVAAYGSGMYKHVYQGTRIFLKNGELPEDDTDSIYLRSIDRIKKRYDGVDGFVDRYIMDNFAAIGSTTRDSNFDRAYVSGVSISMTDPPYTQSVISTYNGQSYTRVFMQFTFSQKAGRWYTTDYRQYPTNYLTPLYGAEALNAGCYSIYNNDGSIFTPTEEQPDNIMPLWINSACSGFNSYRSHLYAPYSVVPPMDIALGCVPYMYGASSPNDARFPYDDNGLIKPAWDPNGINVPTMTRLEKPYLPLDEGGIGLYPPADANGGRSTSDHAIHANFWSVRKFIRPAVSVLSGTDIPTYTGRNNGHISDPTLYDMFDFPVKGEKIYVMPDEVEPEDDTALQILLYRKPGETEDGRMENRSENVKHYMGYGLSAEAQELDE